MYLLGRGEVFHGFLQHAKTMLLKPVLKTSEFGARLACLKAQQTLPWPNPRPATLAARQPPADAQAAFTRALHEVCPSPCFGLLGEAMVGPATLR
jgi:hypothetical protein